MDTEILTNQLEVSAIAAHRHEDECKNCRLFKLSGSEIVECGEKKGCEWVMNFGYSRFCKHPSALQYANLNLFS